MVSLRDQFSDHYYILYLLMKYMPARSFWIFIYMLMIRTFFNANKGLRVLERTANDELNKVAS